MNIYRVETPVDVVVWCERYRVLTTGAELGPWRVRRTPFFAEPMRACVDPRIREVVIMGASQTAKTESVILNILAYKIINSPAPSLLVLPTLEAVRDFSRDRIEPMIASCALLRGLVSDSSGPDAESTMYRKSFPHGHLTMVGSHSASALSRMPIRDLYLSEVDRFAFSAGVGNEEGDPVQLARVRTSTFFNSKIIQESSPTIHGRSRIEAAFARSTQEHWYAPCPLCGYYQILSWERMNRADCTHAREECGEASTQSAWQTGVGEWRPHGENSTTRGFCLSALPSPLISWQLLTEEYRRAKELEIRGDLSQMQVFVNTRLAEPWKEDLEEAEPMDPLVREDYDAEVPSGVLTLVGAIDTQDDRLEYLVVGVGAGRKFWLIECGTVWGSLSRDAEGMYRELDARALYRDWQAPGGKQMRIHRACQDLLGHYSETVRSFARARGRVLIPFAGRAQAGNDRQMFKIVRPHDGRGAFLSGVTGLAKDLIASLRKNAQIHVPSDPLRGFDEPWLAQLDSEVRTTKIRQGQKHVSWEMVSSRVRNEALDLLCMAIILSESLRLRAGRQADYLQGQPDPRQQPSERTSRYGVQTRMSFGDSPEATWESSRWGNRGSSF